jgi:hypothetical protein
MIVVPNLAVMLHNALLGNADAYFPYFYVS